MSTTNSSAAQYLPQQPQDLEDHGGTPFISLPPHCSKTETQNEATSPIDPATTIPDGGLTAWLQCLSSFFLLMNSFGLMNTFGVFQTFYERTLLPHESASNIAWIGSIQAFFLIGLGIVAGPLYDYGYLHALLGVGTVLVVLGMLLTGLCSQYWQLLLAQGVVVGVGSGFLFLPSIAILTQYFKKRLALATGIGSSGSAIGGVGFPILFNKLLPRIGFRWSTWVVALIVLVTLIVPLVAMRMRYRPLKARRLFDTKAWAEPPFSLWACYLFLSLLGLYLPSFYIQLYGINIMSEDLAIYLLPLLNTGSFFGRIIPLYIADKVGPLNIEIPFTLIASILAFGWIFIHNAAGGIAFSIIYGFFAGAITTVTAVVDAALCPSLDVMGVRMGMLLVPWAGGLLIGTPIAGALLHSSGWLGLQAFAGAVLLASTLFGVAVRVTKYGWAWNRKC